MLPYYLLLSLLLNLFCQLHQQPGEAEKTCNDSCIEKIHPSLLTQSLSERHIKIVQRMAGRYKETVKTKRGIELTLWIIGVRAF
jgi:hypothetical protein